VSEIDQSSWPAHLRDGAPYQQCTGCGRKTWDTSSFDGGECRMTQPDGRRCDGVFLAELPPKWSEVPVVPGREADRA